MNWPADPNSWWSWWSVFSVLNQKLNYIKAQLDNIITDVGSMKGTVTKMAVDLTSLQAAVANETGAVSSAVTLIQGMAAEIQKLIDASGNTIDPAALQALADQFNTQSSALAAAVAANPLPPAA